MLEIRGIVVRGKGDGRALGYPTANLEYQSSQIPEKGVWICRTLIGSKEHLGLAIVGMWKLENRFPSLETHLLDFDVTQDLYGQELTVSLELKLRDLKFFPDVSLLVTQIEQDIAQARAYFSS